MGFSTIAASVILFAGFLFLSGVVANGVFEAQREHRDAELEKEERTELRRNTQMALNSVAWQGNKVHIYLKNTGDSVLDANEIEVMIDGVWGTDKVSQRSVDGSQTKSMWAQNQELYLRIDTSPKPQRVYVVTETGIGLLVTP